MARDKGFLVRSIGGIKGRVTFFKNSLDRGIDNQTLGGLRSMQNRLPILYTNFNDTQSELELLDPAEFDSDARNEFETAYGNVEATLLEYIESLSSASKFLKNSDQASTSSYGTACSNNNSRMFNPLSIPLPQLKLPIFDGYFENWNDFKVVYLELIHENNQLSPILKFQYLRSCVEAGKANHFIQSVPASTANYKTVWDSLFKYYENENRVKWLHMRNMYNLKPILKVPNGQAIQEFIDNFWKEYNILKSLNVPVDQWDLYLTFHICELIDVKSREEVEIKRSIDKLMTVQDIIDILSQRARVLEAISSAVSSKEKSKDHNSKSFLITKSDKQSSTLMSTESSNTTCRYCENNHSIFKCDKFFKLAWTEKNDWLIKLNLCRNCLGTHNITNCKSKGCRICNRKHHSLFHITNNSSINSHSGSPTPSTAGYQTSNYDVVENTSTDNSITNQPIASDNQITLENKYECKPLSNSTLSSSKGSASLVTYSATNTSTQNSNESCIFSSYSSILMYTAVIWVHDDYGSKIPCRVLLDCASHSNFITNDFYQKLKVKKQHTNHSVTGLNQTINVFKHFVNLDIESRCSNYKTNINCLLTPKITDSLPINLIKFDQNQLPKSIELADPGFYKPQRIDMLIGAQIYDDLIGNNRISVSDNLPMFRESVFGYIVCGEVKQPSVLNSSNESNNFTFMCCNTKSLRNFRKDSSGRYGIALPLKKNVNDLGNSSKSAYNQILYMEKRLSDKPKLKSTYCDFMNKYNSLNQLSIIPSERSPENPSDFLQQHSVLRDKSLTTKLRVVLNASQKTSNGLSLNNIMKYPTIQHNLFSILINFRTFEVAVADDIHSVIKIKAKMCFLLASGGFEPRKWCFNVEEVDPVSERPDVTTVSTLGMTWNHLKHRFILPQPVLKCNGNLTKRFLLSSIAQLFDPLGFYSTVIFLAKGFIQKLWLLKIDWDDNTLLPFSDEWQDFANQLCLLSFNKIALCISVFSGSLKYGFAIYIRTTNDNNEHCCQSLCAKSKVSPLKKYTIPRLEPCASLLLAELYDEVINYLKMKFSRSILWSYSNITFLCIRSRSSIYVIFVANRIYRIHDLTSLDSWLYIPSQLNPTDIVTRGDLPSQQQNYDFWWHGPSFIVEDESNWPKFKYKINTSPGEDSIDDPENSKSRNLVAQNQPKTNFFVEQYSNYNKWLRMTSVWIRFLKYTKSDRKRIIKVHPEKDKEVRVASVRTSTGGFKRAIQKICILPIDSSANQGLTANTTD